jgi:hypothetical protein
MELRAAGMECGGLDKGQLDCVQRHLALVFKHEIDPSMGPPEKQKVLDAIHKFGTPDKQDVLSVSYKPKIGGVDPVTGAVARC